MLETEQDEFVNTMLTKIINFARRATHLKHVLPGPKPSVHHVEVALPVSGTAGAESGHSHLACRGRIEIRPVAIPEPIIESDRLRRPSQCRLESALPPLTLSGGLRCRCPSPQLPSRSLPVLARYSWRSNLILSIVGSRLRPQRCLSCCGSSSLH
jgi:hypothetical protein